LMYSQPHLLLNYYVKIFFYSTP